MSKTSPDELKEYKAYVKKRLAQLTPALQKAAMGDFSGEIEILEKEDEFSELLVGLSLMIDDLRQLKGAEKQVGEERKKRIAELEKWREITTGRELKMVGLKEEIKGLLKKLGESVE